ncbi:MAG: hypothetical protein KF708_06050 [Pirellulales bacterium]|nr:hypothetical protein [Pirellulales bacterium]
MSQSELLKQTVQVLERLEVPFMLTGSLASSLQGDPRATHDIDIVVQLATSHIEGLLAAFPPPDYYLSRPAMSEAIARRSTFNLLELGEGDKVDFWLLTEEEFDQSRFARRMQDRAGDLALHVSAPEDTIVQKLRWSQMYGGSEKQLQDAIGVYEVQFAVLDHAYLEHWVKALDLTPYWNQLIAQAKPIE